MHFQAGRKPRIGRRGAFDDAQCSTGETHDSYGRILDLKPLMRQKPGIGADLDHRTHNPLQQINRMDRLVHQRATAIERPCPAPCSGVIVGLRAPPAYLGCTDGQTP